MGLFTHYRPHRQDTVKTACVCHVCLNYRQAMTGQLHSSARDESENTQNLLYSEPSHQDSERTAVCEAEDKNM